jgi:hypothetical protein
MGYNSSTTKSTNYCNNRSFTRFIYLSNHLFLEISIIYLGIGEGLVEYYYKNCSSCQTIIMISRSKEKLEEVKNRLDTDKGAFQNFCRPAGRSAVQPLGRSAALPFSRSAVLLPLCRSAVQPLCRSHAALPLCRSAALPFSCRSAALPFCRSAAA